MAERLTLRSLAVCLVLVLAGSNGRAQAPDAPRNDLPQPYVTTRDWGRPPNDAPWAAVTAIEPAPDGSIYVIHRCAGNSCANQSEPPILKFDASGRLLAS